jgi:hypothetical protein
MLKLRLHNRLYIEAVYEQFNLAQYCANASFPCELNLTFFVWLAHLLPGANV